jgi:glycosyltransferase involved in cell wall biosynthesis
MATPYILFVGTIEPRKNLGALVQAFQRVANELEDVTLVIAGNLGWHYEDLLGQLGEPASGPRIYRPGRIPEGDLRGLYSGAAAVVLPSLYEGFGLPALEAMACGTPVVASNRSSLPEVVGDAAILVPPRDVDALARGLLQVLRDADLAERLSRAGRRQAGHFTWDRAARETLAVYRGVAAGA